MIPLSIPNINGNEWQYVKDCLDTGWISSAGAYVTKFEEAIQNYTGVKYAIACMNGTAGLQVSLSLAGVTSDDIVIAPNILNWNSICLLDNGKNIHKQNFALEKKYMPRIIIKSFKELMLS